MTKYRFTAIDVIIIALIGVWLIALAGLCIKYLDESEEDEYTGIGDPYGDSAHYYVTLNGTSVGDLPPAMDGTFAVSYYEVVAEPGGLAHMRVWMGDGWHWFGYHPSWIVKVEDI